VEKDSAVIGIDNEEEVTLNGNHSDMIKFSDRADSDYEIIKDIIKDIMQTEMPARRGRQSGMLFLEPYASS
jgi:hypothetical protein